MQERPLTLAFVMDPIESVDVRADTSFILMLAAQERGHRVLYIRPQDLSIQDGRPAAHVRSVTLRREQGRHADLGPEERVWLDDACDVVLQRTDPPVDAAYITATQILTLCERARVLNRPQTILSANEKLYTLHFRELMPPTCVTRRMDELREFMAKLSGEMIVKPLDGKGGEGIFHVHAEDRNLTSILEQATAFGRRWTMAQKYLPAVREGDKRILLVDGEPLGAILRVPAESEHRANLHVGGTAAATALDAADHRIVERLQPWLRRDGLFFVGIDVIGGLLTEVNVTSPTGIQELSALSGERQELRVIEAIEALMAAGS